jgi:hypothetical protein
VQIETFNTRKLAMERMKEIQPSCNLQFEIEKAHDPEDLKANVHGYVWVISVSLQKNGDKLHLCTDGSIR